MKILNKLTGLLGAGAKNEAKQGFVLDVSHLKILVPFNEMPDNHLQEVLKIARVQSVPARKKLFKRGQEDTLVHYVLQGTVDLLDEHFNITSIKAGDAAGAHALDNETPHRLSAITTCDSLLLEFDKDRLDLLMTWEQAASGEQAGADTPEEDWMSALLESELFSKVPPAHIQQLFATFKSQQCSAGDVIVQEGQPGDRFFVIAAGRARVSRRGADGDRQLAELGAGRFFGEEALIGETTRNATITMETAGKLMFLDKAEFKKLLEEPVLRSLSGPDLERMRTSGQPLVLLDVRLSGEYKHLHDEGSINVPLNRLRDRMTEFAREKFYVVSANAGRRSELGVYLLISAGFQAYLLRQTE
ncbi:MAG TPA: cyclic nucleotide-binding domain-containing protein [Candidatus Kapabacteria bacterium]|nr:cyclic nucleotide-binding domain-containing protein [Candidatus Kapabacteria bacterium]